MKVINTVSAPAAIGPYSQAICAGNLLFTSGQLGLNPQTGELAEGIAAQMEQILENLSALCEQAGTSLNRAVKLTVYLTDLNDFPVVNSILENRLSEPYPARTCVGAKALPKGALAEVDLIAEL